MFVRGEFEFGSTPAMLVPQQSLVVRDGFQQVYAVGTDQRVKLFKVTVGRRQADMIEITDGLPKDANVVVRGAGFLTTGDLVKVVP
jgi:multidrug efflux pump subunit AcrA (membrane-fusion protein)